MTMWICEVCNNEWSAMLGDNEVPAHCECGGEIKEHYSGDDDEYILFRSES